MSSFIKYVAVFELVYSVIVPFLIIGDDVWRVIDKGYVFANGYHYGWLVSALGCAVIHLHSSIKLWKVVKMDDGNEKFKQAETVFQLSLYFPDLALLFLNYGPALIPIRKVINGVLYIYVEELRIKLESPPIRFLQHAPGF